jgi:hypothetical protein
MLEFSQDPTECEAVLGGRLEPLLHRPMCGVDDFLDGPIDGKSSVLGDLAEACGSVVSVLVPGLNHRAP